MNISIFGLGYVGCVCMGCLSQNGHKIIGVDVSIEKVNRINQGQPTIIEKDIDIIIDAGFRNELISATSNYIEAVYRSDISLICVGTPTTDNGHLDLNQIYQTAREIGEALKGKNSFHTIAIRSTVFPGTNKKVCSIIEEVSEKKKNVDFAVVSNPEFMREGTAVQDFLNPPITVLGCDCPVSIDLMASLYGYTNAPLEIVPVEVAEMIKYVNNSFHALKVVFSNEIGNICKASGIDSHQVMRLFCLDNQLNISPYYLKPGFAYGGSCLPKDLRGLKTMAHDLYIQAHVLNSIETSNAYQIEKVIRIIEGLGKNKIGILGLSFKGGTDDMRNSPIVQVIETLFGKGYNLKIFDKHVCLSRLTGKNKSVINKKLPHINVMLQDNIDDIVDWAEVIVIANKDGDFSKIKLSKHQILVDLIRIPELEKFCNYIGLCW